MPCFRRLADFVRNNWAIVVVFASFLHYMLFTGLLYSYNLLHIQFKDSFNCTSTQAAVPGAVSIAFLRCSAVVVTVLFQTLGHRRTVAFGVSLCCLGLLITSFMQDIVAVNFTYGVLYGIGCSTTNLTIVDMVLRNVDKRNATRATSLMFCGVSVGFLITPCLDWLYITYSWRVALRILCVLFAFVGYASSIVMIEMKPVNESKDTKITGVNASETQTKLYALKEKEKESHNDEKSLQTTPCIAINQKNEKSKSDGRPTQHNPNKLIAKYVAVFRRIDYDIALMGFLLASTAVSFTLISVGSYLSYKGMNMPSISITMVWMGASDLTGRIIAAIFSDRIPISRTLQFSINTIIAAVASICLPFITSYNGLKAALIVISIPRSFILILLPTIAMELSSNETRAEAVAFVYLIFGVGALLTPYVTGRIRVYSKVNIFLQGLRALSRRTICIPVYCLQKEKVAPYEKFGYEILLW
ncbi:monocarboxylate transporter 13-like [Anneissia japonica]|uniref:monocarboxylate transporter 13-like n=1 Tax=Anneissia japonica TaxID=1529436 RepID=UPI0014254F2D|nr:monocarboxylate transporter 13-like [Anneissia japonica]